MVTLCWSLALGMSTSKQAAENKLLEQIVTHLVAGNPENTLSWSSRRKVAAGHSLKALESNLSWPFPEAGGIAAVSVSVFVWPPL